LWLVAKVVKTFGSARTAETLDEFRYIIGTAETLGEFRYLIGQAVPVSGTLPAPI
jgi:hypothetical protein